MKTQPKLFTEELLTPDNNSYDLKVHQAINRRTNFVITSDTISTARQHIASGMNYTVRSFFSPDTSSHIEDALKRLMKQEIEENG